MPQNKNIEPAFKVIFSIFDGQKMGFDLYLI